MVELLALLALLAFGSFVLAWRDAFFWYPSFLSLCGLAFLITLAPQMVEFWVAPYLFFAYAIFCSLYLIIRSRQNPKKWKNGAVILLQATLIVVFCAVIFWHWGIEPPSKDEPKRFSDYLYFSLLTFTTLGYGDFKPSVITRLIAALESLLGYVFLALALDFTTSSTRGSYSEPPKDETNDSKKASTAPRCSAEATKISNAKVERIITEFERSG